MPDMRHIFILCISLGLVLSACLPEPEPSIDEATVLRDNTSMRIAGASSARTMYTLKQGERVSIIEKRNGWYRVRDRDQIEGWMDESTILRDTTMAAMQVAVADGANLPVQATARAVEEVNLRLDPGRDTDIIRRLRRGTVLEVLERHTTPRPNSEATDIWFKVRPSEDEIGWVFTGLIEFDTPEPLLGFMEGRTYVAYHKLRQVQDPEAGPIDWYVVAERRADAQPDRTYDGIRVFVWNLAEHQYETTLRLRNLRGIYPLEQTGDPGNPGFRFHVEGADGEPVARVCDAPDAPPRNSRVAARCRPLAFRLLLRCSRPAALQTRADGRCPVPPPSTSDPDTPVPHRDSPRSRDNSCSLVRMGTYTTSLQKHRNDGHTLDNAPNAHLFFSTGPGLPRSTRAYSSNCMPASCTLNSLFKNRKFRGNGSKAATTRLPVCTAKDATAATTREFL